jgi:Protein of unknown function (DUF3891)
MILRPTEAFSIGAGFVPAWQGAANAQKVKSAYYHLVRQPDHARLAGQIAQQLAVPGAPAVDDDIVRGISLHDEGWADFDSPAQNRRELAQDDRHKQPERDDSHQDVSDGGELKANG